MIQDWTRAVEQTLPQCGAVLVHSGSAHVHYADDQAPPFKAWGHFLRWVPLDRPDQFVLFRPGQKPTVLAVVPNDFWHDQALATESWWTDCVELTVLASVEELADHLPASGELAFLGEGVAIAKNLGINPQQINPSALLAWLDYDRAVKSDYEIERIREANALALVGHDAAEMAFYNNADEYDIHLAYLTACRMLDAELPYSSIVGLNEKSAILHYQHKRRYASADEKPGNQVLLIDAGCRAYGYCSDITRTWAADDAHPVFKELLQGMKTLQEQLVQSAVPGLAFAELHRQAHLGVAELLVATDVCRGDAEALVESGVSTLFFPHGLGHLLGLQVHDVGGHQQNHAGDKVAPPANWPGLRTTRKLDEGMVLTIEPGLYIIPALLEPARAGAAGQAVNWSLTDALAPLGGIRIEDNICVRADGAENLTRAS